MIEHVIFLYAFMPIDMGRVTYYVLRVCVYYNIVVLRTHVIRFG